MNPALPPLLDDACQQVMRHPNHSIYWHTLTRHWAREPDPLAREQVLQRLCAFAPPDPVGRFLRATCLADLCANPDYLAEAVQCGLAQQPPEPERLMGMALFHWGNLMRRGGSRRQFVEALQRAQLPLLTQSLGRWAAALQAPMPQPTPAATPGTGTSRLRVAVLASGIGQASHPPTLTALQQVRLLAEQGCQVALFSAQELTLPHMAWYLGNQGEFVMSAPQAEQLAAWLPPEAGCMLADPGLSLAARWQETGQQVAQFAPDLILFIGLFSPMAEALFARYPVLGLCCHSMAPMAQVDLWLDPEASTAPQVAPVPPISPPTPWPPLAVALAQPHPWRVWLPAAGAPVARAEFGCDHRQLLLISVGARLEREIDPVWGSAISELLLATPNCVWLLVGGSGTLPAALAHLPRERLRLLPHQDNIRGLLRCADIYLNPDRIGGGFSVAEAMAEGLATLALRDSDGGAKLGAHAVPDLPAYLSRLRALMHSPSLRQQIGSTLRAQFAATLDMTQSGPALLAACQRAHQLGTARLG